MTFSGLGGSLGTLAAATPFFGPLAPVVGAVAGFGLDTIFGNSQAAAQGRQRRRQEKKEWNYVQDLHHFEKNEIDRVYDYQVDSLQIKKDNDAANRQFQIDSLRQDRDYKMGIRDFEYDQRMRVYNSQMGTFTQQREFNEIAEQMAMGQQDRKKYEDLVGMEFDKAQTLLNYTSATAGLNLKKASAKASADIQLGKLQDTTYLAMDAAKTKTAFGKRQANIEALKASGQLSARGGAGVSAGKAQQGIQAELGAAKAQMSKQLVMQQREAMTNMVYNQRAIVNQLLTTEADADLNLANLNYQLDLDQAKMDISRDNLLANDKLIRDRIKMQRKQADINNEARKPLEPQKTPPIPEVIEPPIPKYPEIFKPNDPPAPVKGVGYSSGNPYSTLGQFANTMGGIISSDSFQKFLTQQMTPRKEQSTTLYNSGQAESIFNFGSTFNPDINLGIANPAGLNFGGFGNLPTDVPFSVPTGGPLVSNPAPFNLNQNFF